MIKTHKGYHNGSGGHQAWCPESNPWRLMVKERTNSFKLPWPPQAHGGKQTYTKLSVFFFLISVKRKKKLKHNQVENNWWVSPFSRLKLVMSVDVSSSSLERPSRWSAILPLCSLACLRRVLDNIDFWMRLKTIPSFPNNTQQVLSKSPPGLPLCNPTFCMFLIQCPITSKGIKIWCHQSFICKTTNS